VKYDAGKIDALSLSEMNVMIITLLKFKDHLFFYAHKMKECGWRKTIKSRPNILGIVHKLCRVAEELILIGSTNVSSSEVQFG
jgi:hypothetical protein